VSVSIYPNWPKMCIEGSYLRCKPLRLEGEERMHRRLDVEKCMSVERLELSTNGLKGRCSAIELHARCGLHSITPPLKRQSSLAQQPVQIAQVHPGGEIQAERSE
jgi:hypothetical protein